MVAGDGAHITQYTLSQYNNVVHESVAIGSRSTIGASCIVGANSTIGDKSSIKKSIVGKGCTIGNHVKVRHHVVALQYLPAVFSSVCHSYAGDQFGSNG